LNGSRTSVVLGNIKIPCARAGCTRDGRRDEDDADARYARIHEQCAVIKIWNWQDMVYDFWRRGSCRFLRSTLRNIIKSGWRPYAWAHRTTGHVRSFANRKTTSHTKTAYKPSRRNTSSSLLQSKQKVVHDHPHDDAIELYVEETGNESSVFHTGESRKSFIFDIKDDESFGPPTDDGSRLRDGYPIGDGNLSESKRSGGFTPRQQPPNLVENDLLDACAISLHH